MRNPEHCPKCGCEGRFGHDLKTFYEATPDANLKLHCCKQTDERNLVIDLVRHSGINAIAEECHRLAVARGKYHRGWLTAHGEKQIHEELVEWSCEAWANQRDREVEEFGDLLHTVLSVGHHMGYDVEAELVAAMKRNAKRAREGA